MDAGAPGRLWVPLLVLDAAGPVETMPRMQKLSYLAQEASGIAAYDFGGGPRSAELAADVARHGSLISASSEGFPWYPDVPLCRFGITEEGRRRLGGMLRGAGERAAASARKAVRECSGMPGCDMMERAYVAHGLPAGGRARDDAARGLAEVQGRAEHYYECHNGAQSTFAAAALQIVGRALEAPGVAAGSVPGLVAACMSREMVGLSRGFLDGMIDPDPVEADPAFLEFAEMDHVLREYCELKGVMRDPLKAPIDEVFTDKEAEGLLHAIEKVQASG